MRMEGAPSLLVERLGRKKQTANPKNKQGGTIPLRQGFYPMSNNSNLSADDISNALHTKYGD